MKVRRADRPGWSRILEKKYKQMVLQDDHFSGYVTLLSLNKVREPLVVRYDSKEVCIVRDGYAWMMHFPDHGCYSVTTAFDKDGNVIQWYFDIIYKMGTTAEGIPYVRDLYLDVVLLPGGHFFIKDEDELEEALKDGKISPEQFDLAKERLSSLVQSIQAGENVIVRNTQNHYETILKYNNE